MNKRRLIALLQEVAALLPDPIPESWPGRQHGEQTVGYTNAGLRRAWNALRSIAAECGISYPDLVRRGGEVFEQPTEDNRTGGRR